MKKPRCRGLNFRQVGREREVKRGRWADCGRLKERQGGGMEGCDEGTRSSGRKKNCSERQNESRTTNNRGVKLTDA